MKFKRLTKPDQNRDRNRVSELLLSSNTAVLRENRPRLGVQTLRISTPLHAGTHILFKNPIGDGKMMSQNLFYQQ